MKQKSKSYLRKYRIIKIDASYILNNWRQVSDIDVSKPYYDLNNPIISMEMVKEIITQYKENDLLDALPETQDSGYWDVSVKSMIILDFDKCGVSSSDASTKDKLNSLLLDGVYIQLKGEETPRHYLQFDKSASMARDKQISYLDSSIYDEFNKRNDLGIDFSDFSRFDDIPIESKYYAYRGLCMSSGDRIPDSVVELNENTVLITDCDTKITPSGFDFITYMVNDEGEIEQKYSEKVKNSKYDGEGLISPEYADALNDYLFYDTGEQAGSFQIRMPFVKGVIHKVDFRKRIVNLWQCHTGNELISADDIYVKDAFGFDRKLSDVNIILTTSMFKCAKWLEDYKDAPADKAKFYFDQVKKYKRSLYVTQTDLNLSNDGKVLMNYQFLNTLDLSHESFEEMIRDNYEAAKNIHVDPNAAKEQMFHKEIDDNAIEGETAYKPVNEKAWEYALRHNDASIYDNYIIDQLDTQEKYYARNIAKGRILVKGKQYYLSGDLMEFMYAVYEKTSIDQGKTLVSIDEVKKLVNASCLKKDYFYASGFTKDPEKENNYYGVLRSPHLARNEECAMRPFDLQTRRLYDRYFSGLKHVFMVPSTSAVPNALGGADYDGDTVKVILDDTIDNAILNGVYEKQISDKGEVTYKRKLPVPYIDGSKNVENVQRIKIRKGKVEKLNADRLKNVFYNEIGLLSNWAVKYGQMLYSGNSDIEDINSSAMFTIATGLEIDSVKTGHKSELLSAIKKMMKEISSDDNQDEGFLKFKDLVSGKEQKITQKSKNGIKKYYYKKNGEDVEFEKKDPSDPNVSNLDIMPTLYFDDYLSSRKRVDRKKRNDMPLFSFELDKDQTIEKENEITAIVNTYSDYNIRTHFFNQGEEVMRDKYVSFIRHLLNIKYDLKEDSFNIDGKEVSVNDALNMALADLADLCVDFGNPDYDDPGYLMNNLKKWAYIEKQEDRVGILDYIIGRLDINVAKPAQLLLCDSTEDSYQILPYIIKDYIAKAYCNRDSANTVSNKEGIDKKLYSKLMNESYNPATESYDHDKAYKKIKDIVLKLYDNDIRKAIKNSYNAQKKLEKSFSFIWEIFDASDIETVLITKNEEKENA